jgi:hypothetical protein
LTGRIATNIFDYRILRIILNSFALRRPEESQVPLYRSLAGTVLVVAVLLPGRAAIGPVAAQERTTVGGYGEVHYSNATGANTPGQVDLRRFVVYLAHAFNDNLALRSELEVEDAKVEPGGTAGELEMEQTFLDYRLADWLTVRTGLVLVPVGIINETHEPPTFNGVARPAFDQDVIPTTWREIGVGAAGTIPGGSGLAYRLYLLNGLRAEGFSAAGGIREGSGEGQDASFANPSLTGRLEWARPGLKVGGSFWYGGTANGDPILGTGTFAAPITLLAVDVRYDVGAASFRGEAANVSIGDAGAIDARYGSGIGRRLAGGYLEAAYNVLHHLAPASSQKLNVFLRHERYDMQASVPAGMTPDRSLARRITTFGLTYKPTWNTAFKGDYQLVRNAAGAGEHEVLSLGMGFQF